MMCNCFKLRRNVVAVLSFLGCVIVYFVRINLSIAIVEMTTEHIVQNSNGSFQNVKFFDWNSKEKGKILSAFFFGYMFTQIIGGYLSNKYGGVTVFGLGVALPSMLTLLTPVCANFSVYAMVVLRALEGICQGCVFPSTHSIWVKWSPPEEVTKYLLISYSGASIGAVAAFSLCGLITERLGWIYSFYIPGALGLAWYVIWFIFITNDPINDPFISEEEKTALKLHNNNIQEKHSKVIYPWKKILTSRPVIAIIVSYFCSSWSGSTLITELPTYLKNRYDYDVELAGFLLIGPYILSAIAHILAGVAADKLRKKLLTTTQVRKLFTCSGLIMEILFTTIFVFSDSPTIAIICLTLSGLDGITSAGSGTNPLDLAPEYASVIFGIANTFSQLASFICPNVAGFIATEGTEKQWKTVFLLMSGINGFGTIFYALFASGELQSWAITESNTIDSSAEKPNNSQP